MTTFVALVEEKTAVGTDDQVFHKFESFDDVGSDRYSVHFTHSLGLDDFRLLACQGQGRYQCYLLDNDTCSRLFSHSSPGRVGEPIRIVDMGHSWPVAWVKSWTAC